MQSRPQWLSEEAQGIQGDVYILMILEEGEGNGYKREQLVIKGSNFRLLVCYKSQSCRVSLLVFI